MSEKTAVRTREKWVDDVKVIACILVVLGHFFQSMTRANILPENDLYKWFITTIYVVLGLGISFAGPIIAAWIMKKTKWLEFFLYPNKLIEKQKGKKKV